MKSSFDSKRHTEIHATKEALRAHAIDQHNKGRTPERVNSILAAEGCTEPQTFMKNLLTGELTASERRIIREVSKKSPDTIPPVTPVQKAEEPKRSVKYTPPAPGTLEDYYMNRKTYYW